MQKRILVLLFSGLAASMCASADTTEWTIAATGGSYCYAATAADGTCDTTLGTFTGPANALVGTDLGVLSVAGLGTPIDNGGSLAITDGELNFVSGASTGSWMWGSPGTLEITGCIATVTTSDTVCTSADDQAVLVSDEFTSVSVGTNFNGTEMTFGDLQGTINSAVAAYFGISTAFTSPSSTLGDYITGLPMQGDSFTSTTNGLVSPTSPGGTAYLVAVPENWNLLSSLGILIFGFAVFSFARRSGLIKTV